MAQSKGSYGDDAHRPFGQLKYDTHVFTVIFHRHEDSLVAFFI